MWELERLTVVISDEFNSQEVANTVDVSNDGGKTGGGDDEDTAEAGGDNIWRIQLATGFKHYMGVSNDGHRLGRGYNEEPGATGGDN